MRGFFIELTQDDAGGRKSLFNVENVINIIQAPSGKCKIVYNQDLFAVEESYEEVRLLLEQAGRIWRGAM